MITNINRRSLIKGAAGAAAVGAASSRFFAPNLIGAQGNTELVFWTAFGSGANGDAQTAVVEKFNAENTDGITVTTTAYASYEEIANAVLTGLDSGDVPNIAVLSDVWWFSFYLRQALADLTDHVEDADDYVESLFVEYQRNGGQWAVPFARSTPLFYYNKEAFEAAGVDESPIATWSDFKEVGQSLVQGNIAGSFAFGNAASYGAWTMHGPVWAFGGRYSDEDFNILVNQAEAVETGEFMRSMIAEGGALAVAAPADDFIAGTVATMIASTGSLGNVTANSTFEFGTAMLPEEKGFGCPTGGSGLAVLANESEEIVAAAAKFLAFCTNTENAATWAESTGYMPVRTSAVESEEYQAFLEANPNNQVAIEQLPKTQPQDSARVFVPNGDQNLGRAWEQILVNDVEAQVAFDECAAVLEEDKVQVLEALDAIEG